MTENFLISWIGKADLTASASRPRSGIGPIAQALEGETYDTAVLISDYPETRVTPFLEWLRSRTETRLTVQRAPLPGGPTHFGQIYEAAVKVVTQVLDRNGRGIGLTFHLSPGTPAMAAVWVILSKTRFPAQLIESSRGHGVRTVSVPFDIAAEFIPDLLREPDRRLKELSAALPPEAPEFANIIHRSRVMKRVIVKARQVAPRNVTVVIEGESGTGKELFARAIHQAGPRRDGPFKVVNCGAIPSALVESRVVRP